MQYVPVCVDCQSYIKPIRIDKFGECRRFGVTVWLARNRETMCGKVPIHFLVKVRK